MISITKDYSLHVEVTAVPTGEHSLKISSTWPGAKDPNEKRLLFQVTGSKNCIQEIGLEISQQSSAITAESESKDK